MTTEAGLEFTDENDRLREERENRKTRIRGLMLHHGIVARTADGYEAFLEEACK